MYEAILNKDQKKEKELWMKSLKKSLKQKNTYHWWFRFFRKCSNRKIFRK